MISGHGLLLTVRLRTPKLIRQPQWHSVVYHSPPNQVPSHPAPNLTTKSPRFLHLKPVILPICATMQRPTTPSIQVDDTAQSATQSQASPQSNPRPRSTASIGNADDEPWRRPSIRIRRLPSNQTVQRTRAASIATAVPREPQRTGSNVEYRGVRHLSVAAGPGADPPTPGSDGHLTVEPPSSSATRPRSGSGSIRHLRHENRSLDSPVPGVDGGRRRSSSDPPQMHWETLPGARGSQRISAYMPPLEEGTATSTQAQAPASQVLSPGSQNVGEVDQSSDHPGYFGVGRRLSNAAGQTYSRFFPTLNTVDSQQADSQEEQYESDIVDVLDTIGEPNYLKLQAQ